MQWCGGMQKERYGHRNTVINTRELYVPAKVILSYTVTDLLFFYWGQEAREQSIMATSKQDIKEAL